VNIGVGQLIVVPDMAGVDACAGLRRKTAKQLFAGSA